ncbi:MAG: riboflavin synthase subunit alpha [Actinomycetota bacterium]|nr:riboflavin synthase subunit alpha [Actinomycetota bacterium]
MYTGITRGTFEVVSLERRPGLLAYAVALPDALREGLETGASVSIDGVCQTVVAVTDEGVHFEAIQETLDLTTLSDLEKGQRVAVERSARVGDEIGGHDVAGHVVGTGTIVARRAAGEGLDLQVEVPPSWMKYVLHKGFIAIDGSSLTVGERDAERGRFDLHLIPETLRLTNLGRRQPGDRVNVELDPRTVAIVDTVERVLEERAGATDA